jgi:phytoene/squalene synthetase
VAASFKRAEEIARQNLPHLYRVARLFPDRARFEAFCALYASMRWIDDEVDEGRMTAAHLDRWEEAIAATFGGDGGTAAYGPALADTLARFEFPPEPWHNLLAAMRYDLEAKGFPSYGDFITYAEGATVAPAAIFATLLLQRPRDDGYRPALPYVQIRDAVRPAAIACYESHILRDAREDLQAGRNYFPRDELKAYHLSPAQGPDGTWRAYLRAYAMRARGGWQPALASLQQVEGPMTPRSRLMLHVLVEFYEFSLRKIMKLDYDVWSGRHWPEPAEVAALTQAIAARYEPDADLSELAVKVIEDV